MFGLEGAEVVSGLEGANKVSRLGEAEVVYALRGSRDNVWI